MRPLAEQSFTKSGESIEFHTYRERIAQINGLSREEANNALALLAETLSYNPPEDQWTTVRVTSDKVVADGGHVAQKVPLPRPKCRQYTKPA